MRLVQRSWDGQRYVPPARSSPAAAPLAAQPVLSPMASSSGVANLRQVGPSGGLRGRLAQWCRLEEPCGAAPPPAARLAACTCAGATPFLTAWVLWIG